MNLAAKALLLATCFLSFDVLAHDVRPALLSMQETSADTFSVLWKRPVNAAIPLNLSVRMPSVCEASDATSRRNVGDFSISQWQAHCAGGLANTAFIIDGLATSVTDVLLQIQFLNGTLFVERLTPDKTSVSIPAEPSVLGVMRSYVLLGVEHILSGIDHLLFVLCIMLLISGKKKLLFAITAFTVAHSLTLVMSILGYAAMNNGVVEVLIALSIVLLAYEVIRYNKGVIGLSTEFPWVVIFVFGLMHGFGFAGALADIGLPANNIPIALLFFNLGVEVGQLLFVVVTLLIVMPIGRYIDRWPNWRITPAYAIGIAGAFWFFQRLATL